MWSQLTNKAKGVWDDVKEQLPQIYDQLADNVTQHLAPLAEKMSLSGLGGEEVVVGPRTLRLLKKIGEGGYSFVYLAEEVNINRNQSSAHIQPPQPAQKFALKKVLAGGGEQLAEAQHEVEVMRSLKHPNILPLIDSAIVRADSTVGSGVTHIVYMLFPLYDENLWDYVQDRLKSGTPLSPREVAHLFVNLCSALEAMHLSSPPLAHRDVKPHNILLKKNIGASSISQKAQGIHGGVSRGTDILGSRGDAAHLVAQPPPAIDSLLHDGPVGDAALPSKSIIKSSLELPHSALMDFGSTSNAVVEVKSRSDALSLQESAERLCTAPYRAPELWDVSSNCTVDAGVDVWSAGCVLFYMLAGETPFEMAANEAGGSLMLAIVNGQYRWPEAVKQRYPTDIQDLVKKCLQVDPSARPHITQLREEAERVLTAVA